VILGGVIVVALGRGGELDRDRPERQVQADFRTWSDVAGYQPPPALLGYNARATQYALSLIARTLAERDAEIAWLRNRIAELRPSGSDSAASSESTASSGNSASADAADSLGAPADGVVVVEDDNPTGELPRVVVPEDPGPQWYGAPPDLNGEAAEPPGGATADGAVAVAELPVDQGVVADPGAAGAGTTELADDAMLVESPGAAAVQATVSASADASDSAGSGE